MSLEIERYNPEQLATPQGFSQVTAVQMGKIGFISGQVSYDREGEIVGVGDIAAQTTQIFENLNHALLAINATFKDVMKFTFFVKGLDGKAMADIRQVRSQYLDSSCLPASTMVGVSALAKPELLLEVEAYVLIKN